MICYCCQFDVTRCKCQPSRSFLTNEPRRPKIKVPERESHPAPAVVIVNGCATPMQPQQHCYYTMPGCCSGIHPTTLCAESNGCYQKRSRICKCRNRPCRESNINFFDCCYKCCDNYTFESTESFLDRPPECYTCRDEPRKEGNRKPCRRSRRYSPQSTDANQHGTRTNQRGISDRQLWEQRIAEARRQPVQLDSEPETSSRSRTMTRTRAYVSPRR